MGIVTDEMLSMPKTPFIVVGLLEALGAATGMAAGGNVVLNYFSVSCQILLTSPYNQNAYVPHFVIVLVDSIKFHVFFL